MNTVRMRPYCSGTTNLLATDLKNHRIKSVKDFAFQKGKTPTQLYQHCADQLYNFCHGQASYMLNWTDAQVEESSVKLASGLVELGQQLSDPDPVIQIAMQMLSKYRPRVWQHSKRVADLCYTGGKHLIGEYELGNLHYAALLHDLGKIFVPQNTLHSEERWSGNNNDYRRLHLLTGYSILKSIPSLSRIAEIIRYNHIFDGYPTDISQKDFSLPAQILSFWDCYDALRAERSYHNGHTEKQISQQLLSRPYDAALIEFYNNSISCKA